MTTLSGYYVHKIAPSAADKIAEFTISGNAFSNKNTLAKALREAGVLPLGGRLKHFRVSGDQIHAFPAASVWHCIVLRVEADDTLTSDTTDGHEFQGQAVNTGLCAVCAEHKSDIAHWVHLGYGVGDLPSSPESRSRGITSVAIAFTIGFLALIALTSTGCEPVPPAGVELDAGPALDVVLAAYGSQAAHPRVFAVEYDCSDTHDGGTGFGFAYDGACVGGATTDDGNIHVVLRPGNANRYSDHLAHEARHVAAGGDMDPHHTSPGFYADVARAQAALLASSVDMMPVGTIGVDRVVK